MNQDHYYRLMVGFRKMARNMAKLLPPYNPYEVERASGLCVCEGCGVIYYDHPQVCTDCVIVRTCDGRLWKL